MNILPIAEQSIFFSNISEKGFIQKNIALFFGNKKINVENYFKSWYIQIRQMYSLCLYTKMVISIKIKNTKIYLDEKSRQVKFYLEDF